jgi:hypothetical protein
MDNEKNIDFETDSNEQEQETASDSAPRARNRTVLLTPEITGQVRARLAQQTEDDRRPGAAFDQHNPAYGGGFVVPPRRPAAETGFGGAARGPVGAPHGLPAPRGHDASAGTSLPMGAAGSALDHDTVVWNRPSKVIGCLISFDSDSNGDLFVLRVGRLVVTSQQPPGGSFLFIKDESISMMHAVLRVGQDGVIQVLDQLSEHGTLVRRFGSGEEIQLSGDKCEIQHGDIVKFGGRSFHVCLLARQEETAPE